MDFSLRTNRKNIESGFRGDYTLLLQGIFGAAREKTSNYSKLTVPHQYQRLMSIHNTVQLRGSHAIR
jgi:hypothetical protein